jgi:predicted lipoprotein with Yx(FWY)xxD motif
MTHATRREDDMGRQVENPVPAAPVRPARGPGTDEPTTGGPTPWEPAAAAAAPASGTPPRRRPRRLVACGLIPLVGLAAACGSSGTSATTTTTAPAAVSSTTTSASAPSSHGTAVVTTTHNASLGTILTNVEGQVLYTFTVGADNAPCNASCRQIWPPALLPHGVTTPSGPAGVGALATTTLNGVTQLTVGGLALYTYAGDSAPGVANGNNLGTFGGVWKVVKVGSS